MYSEGSYFEDDNRSIVARVQYNDDGYYVNLDDSNVKSFSIKESAVGNSSISMGTTNSATLNLELINLEADMKVHFRKGTLIRLRITVTGTSSSGTSGSKSLTLGTFLIDTVEYSEFAEVSNLSCKITAYDDFQKTERTYVPGVEAGSTIAQVIDDIANQCDMSVTSNWSDSITIDSYPEDASCREMIGYLASLQGGIAYIKRNGSLDVKWYTTCSKVISREEQYASGLTFNATSDSTTGDTVTIKYLESGSSDNVIVYPSSGVVGESISFENPLMTEDILTSIYNSKIKDSSGYKVSFTPLTVKWRGNPEIELCEIVNVTDKTGTNLLCYLMEREINYDGGLTETYTCYGENETTVSFSSGSVLAKLSRKMTAMESAIQEATKIIGDVESMQGGTFTIIPSSDGSKNIGWKIESGVSNHYILANVNGIGFSSNGGESFDSAAIYFDDEGYGHINGNYITANSITADQINLTNLNSAINDEIASGVITIGNGTITGMEGSLSDILEAQSKGVENAKAAAETAESMAGRYFDCDGTYDSSYVMKCYLSDGGEDITSTFAKDGAKITVYFTSIPSTLPEENVYLSLYNKNGTSAVISAKTVMFNGGLVKYSSSSFWKSNSTVAFTYESGKWYMNDNSMASTAYETANNFKNAIDDNTNTIATWCYNNDRTVINGGKIAAGTITTQSLNVGWSSGNYIGEGWTGDTGYYSDSVDGNRPKISVSVAFTSRKNLYSTPFYCTTGAQICYEGVVKADGTNYGGMTLQYCDTVDGTYTEVDASYFNSSSDTQISQVYSAAATGYYRVTIFFEEASTSCYIKNLLCTTGITGKMVVNGTIESVDGSTYFDLNNNVLVTDNGTFATEFASGYLRFSVKSVEKGYMFADSDYMAIGASGKYGLSLGYGSTDNHYMVAEIRQGAATEGRGGQIIAGSDTFCTLINKRTIWSYDESTKEYYISDSYYSKAGVGLRTYNKNTYYTASLELTDSANSIIARLDVGQSFGEALMGIRGQIKGDNTSPWLEFGSSDLWWNSHKVLTTISDLSASNISGRLSEDNLPTNVLYSTSTLNGSNITGPISNGSSIAGTSLLGNYLTCYNTISLGPSTYGNNTGGHLYGKSAYGTNWYGYQVSNGHTDGTYGVELVDDNYSSAVGIKLRPTTASYAHYLGSDGQRWSYGYFKNCIGSNAYVVDSDRKLKTEIVDLPDTYEKVFDNLRPVAYKMKDGDRIHTGFIAQEVEDALTSVGFTSDNFSGLCKNPITSDGEISTEMNFDGLTDESIRYSLRYTDFIALCVDKIQKLEKRIKVLEGS